MLKDVSHTQMAVIPRGAGAQGAPALLDYSGPACTFLSGLPSSASASAFSSFWMSSGDRLSGCCRLGRPPDVLVEPDQVARIVLGFQRREAHAQ